MDEQTTLDPVRERARQLAEEHFRAIAVREEMQRDAAAQQAEADAQVQAERVAFQEANEPWVPFADQYGRPVDGKLLGRTGVVVEKRGMYEQQYQPADERALVLNLLAYWRARRKQAGDRFHQAQDYLSNGGEPHDREVRRLIPLEPDGTLPDPGLNGEGYLKALLKPHAEASACVAALEARFEALPQVQAARQAEADYARFSEAEEAARQRRLEVVGSVTLG